jgi:hypothetical protein
MVSVLNYTEHGREKEAVVACLRHPIISLDFLKKSTKHISQDNRSPDQHSYPVYLEVNTN